MMLLLYNDCNIEVQDKEGTTALMLAAKRGYLEIAKTLLSYGAKATTYDKAGMVALDYAR